MDKNKTEASTDLSYKSLSKKTFLKAVGTNIKKWRILKEIKQEELANRIGISKGALSLIESGKTNTSLGRIQEIARSLDISEKQLLFFDPTSIFQTLHGKDGS